MKYTQRSKVSYYNGCKFDSRLELRYALFIETNYAYLVKPIKIYDSYYRKKGREVEIYEHTGSYEPDFLIRSYKENIAAFIETKPDNYKNPVQMEKRNRIVGRYCDGLQADITFEWVFDGGFRLDKAGWDKYQTVIENQRKEKQFYDLLTKFYSHDGAIPFIHHSDWSDKEYSEFVRFGTNPIRV